MPAPAPRLYAEPEPPRLHVLYDNNLNLALNNSPAMLGYLAQNFHILPPNPYPSPTPPPSIPHKVWILDCKSCDTFLTNRGMKAVLLLRPNVSLYSSDALPVNCSAYTSNPDVLRPRASCRPSTSSHHPPRTCECLTQTLCCHGCGSAVGYMIVIPCTRCTSSITATNRATNGHRFVFHSSEIVGTERHYIPDEPGVIPHDPAIVAFDSPPNVRHFAYPPAPPGHQDPYASYRTHDHAHRSRSSSPALVSDYLPTPPLELADPILTSSGSSSFTRYTSSEPYPFSQLPGSISQHFMTYPRSRSRSPSIPLPSQTAYHPSNRLTSAASSQSNSPSPPPLIHSFSFSVPAEQKESPPPRKLQSGDVLFWHHLARHGEISGVEDDERARGKISANAPAPISGKSSAAMGFSR